MRVATIFLFIFISNAIVAQKKCNEKALSKSQTLAAQKKYYKGIQVIKRSLNRTPKCDRSIAWLAELYYRTGQHLALQNTIIQLYQVNGEAGEQCMNYILKLTDEFNEDNIALTLVKGVAPTVIDKYKPYFEKRIEQLSKSVLAQESNSSSVPQLESSKINTGKFQSLPSVNFDGTAIYYSMVNAQYNEQVMVSRWDSCNGWAIGKELPDPPNTSFPESCPRLTPNGKYLVVTRCDVRSQYGWEGGGCDLALYYKDGDTAWSSPKFFGATINSPGYEGQACIGPKYDCIYFVSNREGGYGGNDIWVTTLEDHLWQKPINLGPKVNTSGDEQSPFLHADNQSLYFSSNGHNGIGGQDIFKVNLSRFMPVNLPQSLGYPINTKSNEYGLTVTANGINAWYNRSESDGACDILKVNLPQQVQAKPMMQIAGKVYDKFTNAKIKNKLITLKNGDRLIDQFRSNSGDGSFEICLPIDSAFTLEISESEIHHEFVLEVDPVENKLWPITYSLPIALKEKDVIDTLYQAIVLDDSKDTSLFHLMNEYCRKPSFATDSLVLYLTCIENTYRDSTFLNTHSFSEDGLKKYLHYLEINSDKNTAATQHYINAYLHNVKSKYHRILVIPSYRKELLAIPTHRFKLNLNLVEYY